MCLHGSPLNRSPFPPSQGLSTGEERPADGGWDPWPLPEVPWNLPEPAHPAWTRGSPQNLWWVLMWWPSVIYRDVTERPCCRLLLEKIMIFIVWSFVISSGGIVFSIALLCCPLQAMSTVSTTICFGCLNTEASPQKATTCSWGTTWTEGSSHWRPSACF